MTRFKHSHIWYNHQSAFFNFLLLMWIAIDRITYQYMVLHSNLSHKTFVKHSMEISCSHIIGIETKVNKTYIMTLDIQQRHQIGQLWHRVSLSNFYRIWSLLKTRFPYNVLWIIKFQYRLFLFRRNRRNNSEIITKIGAILKLCRETWFCDRNKF